MAKQRIVYMSTADIEPYEHNPRVNDDSVQYVANSIRSFGFRNPIIVDSKHVIIAGHTRWKAAQSLGLKEVPVIVAEDMTEEQAKAYRLADNKAGESSEQTGRRCFMLEIDPHYCDVILSRWEKMTGMTAERCVHGS